MCFLFRHHYLVPPDNDKTKRSNFERENQKIHKRRTTEYYQQRMDEGAKKSSEVTHSHIHSTLMYSRGTSWPWAFNHVAGAEEM